MKSCTLIFIALMTVLLYVEYTNAEEMCLEENCLAPEKCEQLRPDFPLCYQRGTLCCSVVKSEFRTHCHQHGGACMDSCSSILQRDSVDCTGGKVCCVLV